MVEVVILELLSAEKSTVQSESVQKIAKMPKMCNIQRGDREGGVLCVCESDCQKVGWVWL